MYPYYKIEGTYVETNVMDTNTLNLNPDPDFWPNMDPDPDPDPGSIRK